MTELEKSINEIRQKMPDLKKQYKVKNLGIFGSSVTGKSHKRSDVDILVEFEDGITLFGFVKLERELTSLLGKKVDLVMKSALKPGIGERILKEVRYV